MNTKRIAIIIGVIATAVFGLMWLQMDLIRTSIRVNEEKFDKNIFEALNTVVERLERQEELEADRYKNGYNSRLFPTNGQTAISASLNNLQSPVNSLSFGEGVNSNLLPNNRPFGQTFYNYRNPDEPLRERMDMAQLDDFLRQELSNRGIIDIAYSYVVFSEKEQGVVLSNGREIPTTSLDNFSDVAQSLYQVALYKGDTKPPGSLMIYFPTKGSVLWSSLWLNFLGAALCILLIMACFGYTIHVIFRQKKVSEMKTDFINNMTHEFKTPIATISLAADSITSPRIVGDASKVGRFANIIKQENKRMNNQVEKVLQMAQIDKRDFSLKIAQVNLHDVIRQAVENICLQVEKKDGDARAELRAELPVVEGDMTHISNVINNLLDNANKYSPEQPDITVTTQDRPGGVEVTVRDRGIGMNAEARKHIFDKFYRVHTGNLHDVKGFGLGLSYVKAMMNAHKGTIDVKSEPGKGSSFILYFPHRLKESN